MSTSLNFKISSALKDLIGRDLITDDYIAVFELVKNSYDAYATKVDIFFKNFKSDNPVIVIMDDGKGMNFEDLQNKWLFVAYSAKKEGNEDDNFDYRDSIYRNRPFAGAKGIGRFSCDRLGRYLYLETKKMEKDSKVEVLTTDWGKFEQNAIEEFVNVEINHESPEISRYDLQHGTVLEISQLRKLWTPFDLIKLKQSLSKLINPAKGDKELNFKIFLHVPDLADEDEEKEEYERANGEIRNYIFDELDLRTTKIHAFISADSSTITTELFDRETLIYRIKEPNRFSQLEEMEFTIYYMNASAKNIFTRRMGLTANKFGHIFVYKNGFRVYPYGEPGEDSFKIDLRKTQGRNRYLGTGELIGRIEIFANNGSDGQIDKQLKETTSRGDGLIKTAAYYKLEECFFEVLKRLEKYVVDVQQWGLSIEDEGSFNLKTRASNLLAKLTDSPNIKDFETSPNFFEILEASQLNSANTIVRNLRKIAIESGDDELIEKANLAVNKLVEIQTAREDAERLALVEQQRATEATEKLREQISENLFLKSINTSEFEEVISLIHHIGIYAGTIDSLLKGISLRVQNSIQLTNEELYEIIRSVSFETKKILNIAAFATKAKFKLDTEQIETDLVQYIREYIENIVPSTSDKSVMIKVKNLRTTPFIKKVKPIELNIVIDNLISNSRKAKADKLDIEMADNDGKLEVKFTDNGMGIEKDNLKRIYDFGYTTTDGSGIGLFHVRDIIKSLGGTIKAENNIDKGVTFTIDLKQ